MSPETTANSFQDNPAADLTCRSRKNRSSYRKFGLKPRRFTTALSYNGKSDNQAKN
ncbi:MAG: hypothetical protein GPJ20_19625 [Microcystis aeruginosa BS13-10]|uniref:Uncharacterized protein n=1 Tax=Microcystis aeruginosa G11-04 TaxID=2685956 RepID=A0A966L6G1_MICAE|nr:hypothetical protein [Microcystis aeruginosa LE13-04]NCR67820.1 hypothetical protein [Microcystis aeruginosa LL11-07]NCS12333.1 hypothetical protein [Microcystis aeruginosa G13-09]NCS41005.1 hypothetical protein [Microcystis aeruginosa BS13-10]NCS58477.1 hypothetical protein [Microcystis aeruginosa G11-04]